MSIELFLSSIQTDRNTIRAKLVELGMANNTDKLNALALAISELVDQGAVRATVKEGSTYTIPRGYHNGSGTVSGVSSGGSSGVNYTLQSKVVTPTKKQQNITPDDGYYGMSDVTVKPIPDHYQDVSSVTARAEEVITGRIIVTADGSVLAGTMPNNGTVDKVLNASVVSYTIPRGFHSGSGVVSIVIEEMTVTPNRDAQIITPSSGKVLGKVVVNPIPNEYQDVSGVTATSQTTLDGYKFIDATGKTVVGSIPNNGAINEVIDGLTTTEILIPAGYTNGGRISFAKDIENALSKI